MREARAHRAVSRSVLIGYWIVLLLNIKSFQKGNKIHTWLGYGLFSEATSRGIRSNPAWPRSGQSSGISRSGSLANEKSSSSASASGLISSSLASQIQRAQSREGPKRSPGAFVFVSFPPSLSRKQTSTVWQFCCNPSQWLGALTWGQVLMKPKDSTYWPATGSEDKEEMGQISPSWTLSFLLWVWKDWL